MSTASPYEAAFAVLEQLPARSLLGPQPGWLSQLTGVCQAGSSDRLLPWMQANGGEMAIS